MQSHNSIKAFEFEHLPVLSSHVLDSIDKLPPNLLEGGLIIDATIGGGGHSALILEKHPHLHLIGIDQDQHARAAAKDRLINFSSRVKIVASNFADFKPPKQAVFVLADLGVSSPQLDVPSRGFSFRQDGPIDMRMNQNESKTAAEILANLQEKELADLIYAYGEEKFSRRIAKRIKKDLFEKGSYTGTKELAYAITGCYPHKMRHGRIHPATKTFQALRIAVNNEIEVLEKFLKIAPDWLTTGGLLNLISFHSLEDKLVKSAFLNDGRLERITRKPLQASPAEKETNPRSRSAKFRIAKKRLSKVNDIKKN